jgi:nucleotide-binding universal stress UspA family protein
MFRKILSAVDGSTNSDRALEEAVRLAKLDGASLVVCHAFVIPEQYKTDLADELEEGLAADAEKMLTHAVRLAAAEGIEAERRLLKQSPPADAVAGLAAESCADLIVAGVRGRTSDEARPMGSVSRAIAERAPCSVLLIRRVERRQGG